MRFGFPISLLLHALILGWSLIAMKSTRDFKKPDVQPIALEIITAEELAQMRKGDDKSKELTATAAKDAQGKAEKEPPKPKVTVTAAAPPPPPPAPPEPVKEPPKPDPIPDPIQEKIEQAAKEPPPPKPPEPKPPEVKPPEPPKPEPQKPEADDALAAMKDNQPKPPPLPPAKPPEPPPKVVEKKPPPPPKPKPAPPAPKVAEAKPTAKPAPPANKPSSFDEQMKKAGLTDDSPPDPLLNKDPRKQQAMQSTASAEPTGKPKTAAGARDGQGQKVSQNEMAALAGQLARMIKGCYRAQAGNAVERGELVVKLRFDLGPDGMLRGEPTVLEAARFSLGTQWALSALKGCQPYRLDPEKYQAWKEWDFVFEP
jgi:outer membrane biosynthesis protein TonB